MWGNWGTLKQKNIFMKEAKKLWIFACCPNPYFLLQLLYDLSLFSRIHKKRNKNKLKMLIKMNGNACFSFLICIIWKSIQKVHSNLGSYLTILNFLFPLIHISLSVGVCVCVWKYSNYFFKVRASQLTCFNFLLNKVLFILSVGLFWTLLPICNKQVLFSAKIRHIYRFNYGFHKLLWQYIHDLINKFTSHLLRHYILIIYFEYY